MDFSHTKKFVFSTLEWAFTTAWNNLWFFLLFHAMWCLALFGTIASIGMGILSTSYILRTIAGGNIIINTPLSFAITTTLAVIIIIFAGICCSLVAVWSRAGLTTIAFRLYDGKQFSLSDAIPPFSIILKCAIGEFLFNLGLAISSFLLIVPGIIFILTFPFWQQFVIDENCSVITAFRKSAALTRHKKINLLFALLATWFFIWYGGAFLATLFAGKIFTIIWIMVTMPISSLIYTFAYRELQKNNTITRTTDERNLCSPSECE
ncbi:MAG: hypothetical protein WCE21_02905 [Candidatus Babeliales bacterium]